MCTILKHDYLFDNIYIHLTIIFILPNLIVLLYLKYKYSVQCKYSAIDSNADPDKSKLL